MKESIKKRIEAVRRGEVPEGYVSKSHQLRPVDWKYEKIGKYLVPYDEFSNDTKAYPLATSSRQGLMLQSEYYIDQRYEETTGGFHVVPVDYVTYRHMSDDDIFRFNLNKIGQPVLVSPEYPVFTTTRGLNQDLLVAYLNGMKEFQAFCSAQKKGSTRTRMYFRRLCEFTMPAPSITEQQKIAEILATCDRVIELKQSKIDELNKLKQVCLLEMFPQKGQTIPKRRFPSFSAPWEQRKFSDLVETRRGLTYKPTDIREKGVRVLRSSNIDEDRFVLKPDDVFVDESAINIGFAKENDILITAANGSSRLVGKHAIVSEISDKSTVHGGFMLLGTSDEPYFANAFMSSAWYKRFIDLYVSGGNGAIGNLNKSDLDDQDILVPQKKEQQAIGHFFENLDNLITLHQRELAEVGKYKKALMQLLLTGLVRVNA